MSVQNIIEIHDGVPVQSEFAMAEPVNFSVAQGEQVAIFGPNGAGKSRLVDFTTGRRRLKGDSVRYDFSPSEKHYVYDNIRSISFRDSYGEADEGYYYQKRWNQMDIDPEFVPTVADALRKYVDAAEDKQEAERKKDEYAARFGLDALMDKFVIALSSGELRKLQLLKTLIMVPRVLIIDNPFIGLDARTRLQVSEILGELTENPAFTLILVVSRKEDIPSFITHVVRVEGLKVFPKEEWKSEPGPEDVIKFNDINIRYGERTIIKDLNWRVRKGEHWILTGENGCGKSTLLSLVCADNPQAYACNIELFGRRRGSGESIWDIKKNIGFVSPELHRAFKFDLTVREVVASGFFDTLGVRHSTNEQQDEAVDLWMRRLGIEALADRSFQKVSSGEQRLALVARVFVKDPKLLILDEPMHGLDDTAREALRRLLDEYFSENPEKTLLMVTHYMEEMPDCIDHHLILARH